MLAIALGDPTGIGPEIALKALAAELPRDDERYLLVGDLGIIARLNHALGLGLSFGRWDGAATTSRISVHSPHEALSTSLLPGVPEAARAAVAWVKTSAEICLRGQAGGVVTGPVNKESIIRAGYSAFVGQTELLSELAGTSRTAMMLLGADDRGRWLRVALATIHVPLREVSARLTREKIELAIELAATACRDLSLPRARVAVCGLNPHAGEGGKIGDEEIKIITPAVEAMQQREFDVHGPFAADTLFYYVFRGDYDAVVAMYHDQGLVPLKMIGFEHGVNWTLGLPFVRTSPDHGTAYDIAGKNVANPSSMVAAIQLAKQLIRKKAVI
jgi:4-hydroxythreonine-4-phosphate dehydrogenase